MGLFKSISYEAPTLKVGAGCTWDEVYRYLAESNPDRNVVGGERGIRGVGVSGYLLGSGFSVKTGQYGLGIDGIRSIEVVLPDGRIKSVDKDTDKDLFWALKVRLTFKHSFYARSGESHREAATILALSLSLHSRLTNKEKYM